MKKLTTPSLVLFALLTFFACQKDGFFQDSSRTVGNDKQQDTNYYTPNLAELTATDRSACDWTEIPAGSVNALAAAISNTCPGGVIYLKSGIHTENALVLVNKSVKIVGEAGAVLKLNSALAPATPAGAIPVNASLHVRNAPGTLIQNIDIQPVGTDAGCAVLLEGSDGSAVIGCKITNFQFSILVEKSDRVALIRNTIHATSAWQTGAIPEAHGIVVINGKSAYIAENDIENALFGIWPCDRWGTCERNITHANMVGIILCKVPPYLILPSGAVAGAEFSSTSCKVSENKSKGNFDNGIMVIDGSNGNRVWDNEVTGNGLSPLGGTAADIEIFTDSYIFGFLTPATFNNSIDATKYPGSKIRNCSTGNTIVGGTMMNGGCR